MPSFWNHLFCIGTQLSLHYPMLLLLRASDSTWQTYNDLDSKDYGPYPSYINRYHSTLWPSSYSHNYTTMQPSTAWYPWYWHQLQQTHGTHLQPLSLTANNTTQQQPTPTDYSFLLVYQVPYDTWSYSTVELPLLTVALPTTWNPLWQISPCGQHHAAPSRPSTSNKNLLCPL